MSRKKINLQERFCGVHRAEWLRIASDVPEGWFRYSGVRCVSCHFVECDKCEQCVIDRVCWLAHQRTRQLHGVPTSELD